MLSRQEIRQFIQRENASHQVVIWSKSYCPYCAETKHLFENLHAATDVVIHEIDEHSQGRMIQIELQRLTIQRTVPNVFVRNQHLGGNDDVQKAHRDGSLLKLLLQQEDKQKEETDLTIATSNLSELIKHDIDSHDVVLFTKSYCPYCHATQRVIASKLPDADVVIYELDNLPNGTELQQQLYEMTGQRTVPNVFINGNHVGGNDDTQVLLASSKPVFQSHALVA